MHFVIRHIPCAYCLCLWNEIQQRILQKETTVFNSPPLARSLKQGSTTLAKIPGLVSKSQRYQVHMLASSAVSNGRVEARSSTELAPKGYDVDGKSEYAGHRNHHETLKVSNDLSWKDHV